MGVPMSDYHDDKTHLSSSAIKTMCHSDQWEFKKMHVDEIPEDDNPFNTKDTRYGRAVHAMLDGTFDDQFEVVDRLSPGCPEHQINATDHKKALRNFNALCESPMVRFLRKTPGALFEPTYYSERNGVKVKARPDIVLGNTAYDLKTARDPRKAPFSRAIYNLGYHISAAMVCLVTGCTEYVWIAIQKKYPYRVVTHRCGTATMDAGIRAYDAALELIQDCRALGDWPQSDAECSVIDIPDWAFSAELKGEDL